MAVPDGGVFDVQAELSFLGPLEPTAHTAAWADGCALVRMASVRQDVRMAQRQRMSAAVRGYLLLQTVFLLVLGAVLMVALLLDSLWVTAGLVTIAWLVFAFLLRWLLRSKPQPNEWLWQRGDDPGKVCDRLRQRWPALLAVAVLGTVLIGTQVADLSNQVAALVDGAAVLLVLAVAWVGERGRRTGGGDAE